MLDFFAETAQFLLKYGIYIIDVVLAFFGYFLTKTSRLPASFLQRITQLLVTIVYPCLIFSALTSYFRVELLLASWDMPLVLVALMGSGFAIGLIARNFAPMKHWPSDIRNSFIFMAAMPNYVFIPLMITQAFWGVDETAFLILTSFGGDLFLWLIAIPTLGSRGQWLKPFLKPPVLALIAAISIILADKNWIFDQLEPLHPFLQGLGSFTVPLSMFVLGSYLGSQAFTSAGLRSQMVLTGVRLLLTPLICGLILFASDWDPVKTRVIFLISTMPTAIASAILAKLFQGNPAYCAQQVLISHVLALLSVPLWLYWGTYFF
ncbi:MAG: AEC family transporter [Oligoflexus sp.]